MKDQGPLADLATFSRDYEPQSLNVSEVRGIDPKTSKPNQYGPDILRNGVSYWFPASGAAPAYPAAHLQVARSSGRCGAQCCAGRV